MSLKVASSGVIIVCSCLGSLALCDLLCLSRLIATSGVAALWSSTTWSNLRLTKIQIDALLLESCARLPLRRIYRLLVLISWHTSESPRVIVIQPPVRILYRGQKSLLLDSWNSFLLTPCLSKQPLQTFSCHLARCHFSKWLFKQKNNDK